MILVDPRTGSGDLVGPLKRLGCPAQLSTLEFADLMFLGRGPGESPVPVGIEVKTIGDVVQCMTTGRFAAHQLPGLLQQYETVWLVIEGQWRADWKEGVLQVWDQRKKRWWTLRTGSRRWMWREVQGWVQTVIQLAGVQVWCAPDRNMTTRFCAGLYHWWTDKGYEEHRALKTFVDYKAAIGSRAGNGRAGRAVLLPPTVTRRVAKELPGLGWERSEAAALHFGTVERMIQADVKEWEKVAGVGKKTAERIVRAIREGKE